MEFNDKKILFNFYNILEEYDFSVIPQFCQNSYVQRIDDILNSSQNILVIFSFFWVRVQIWNDQM